MGDHDVLAERFEEHRGHLRGVAYRMLGSLSEADDAVQEAWLRLSRSDTSGVENLGGWREVAGKAKFPAIDHCRGTHRTRTSPVTHQVITTVTHHVKRSLTRPTAMRAFAMRESHLPL